MGAQVSGLGDWRLTQHCGGHCLYLALIELLTATKGAQTLLSPARAQAFGRLGVVTSLTAFEELLAWCSISLLCLCVVLMQPGWRE